MDIQDYLTKLKEDGPDYEKSVIRTNIVDKLVQYAGYEKYVYSIQIIDHTGYEYLAGERVVETAAKKE
ncbi:hypothetical protein D3C73_1248010 [compost metagenome]